MTREKIPSIEMPPGSRPETVDARRAGFLLSLSVPAIFGTYLLLTSTTPLIHGLWPYDAKRILQFALLSYLFLLPALNTDIRRQFRLQLAAAPAWLLISLSAMMVWGLISAGLNARSLMHAVNSLAEVALLSTLVLGVFLVAACRKLAGTLFDRIAVGLLALTGLTVGTQELIGVAAAHSAGVDFNFRVSLMHFSWPRFYNQVQSWMVPALVALPLLFSRYRLAYLFCIVILGLQWYIILMTGGRGSFVSITAAVTAAVLFIPIIRSLLLKWQLAGFLLGALLFSAVLFSFESAKQTVDESPTGPAVTEAQTETEATRNSERGNSFFEQSVGRPMANTSGRIWMWRMTLQDSSNSPWFGIGPMNYVCTSPKRIGHPHNFPLQLAAEWGIPVALAASIMAVFLVWRAGTGIRRDEIEGVDDRKFAGLLLTGVVSAGLHACLSGIMVMPASQVTGLLLCGTLLGLFPITEKWRSGGICGWSFLPALIVVLGLGVLAHHELETMSSRAEALSPGESMWPRIWQDAKVCQFYTVQYEVKN